MIFTFIDKSAPLEHNENMKRMITIIEFPGFLSQVGNSISASERDEFINFIARNPEAGDLIPGTGGVRKVRWGSNNKGKSGGVRVIYYFYDELAPVFLLTAYGKGEKENLTVEQKKQISALAQILKSECKNRRSQEHD
ncbi:type II toxin-antitoxin system RelE/ParE family toxin [Legionella quateirensis]|uniref:Toxin higB-2 n=1 Tax=Legionella quateirensis TaxID=45072 RepID=A0A378PA16_9GAMM|nr:type II toxin-antitoxin system RelE/ParE family toxin [Legionella quateirensis]KTD53947.1 Toxin higB-2 [Legionella quateirensis]STY83000.1 Toxin higB-2 [Legionella quateirensis]